MEALIKWFQTWIYAPKATTILSLRVHRWKNHFDIYFKRSKRSNSKMEIGYFRFRLSTSSHLHFAQKRPLGRAWTGKPVFSVQTYLGYSVQLYLSHFLCVFVHTEGGWLRKNLLVYAFRTLQCLWTGVIFCPSSALSTERIRTPFDLPVRSWRQKHLSLTIFQFSCSIGLNRCLWTDHKAMIHDLNI